MGEIMVLPFGFYLTRYQKAFSDLQFIVGTAIELEQQLEFMKQQKKLAKKELKLAERTLRSAAVSLMQQSSPESTPEPGAEIPEAVVQVLKTRESLQPAPGDDSDPDKGAS